MQQLTIKIAAAIFLLVAILHAARVLSKTEVTIGKFVVPLWMSMVGIIAALSMAILMFKSIS